MYGLHLFTQRLHRFRLANRLDSVLVVSDDITRIVSRRLEGSLSKASRLGEPELHSSHRSLTADGVLHSFSLSVVGLNFESSS